MSLEAQFPLIFAHRGASKYAPENTLEAFDLAIKQGAVAVEFDVKYTLDKVPVIIHDQTVDRTTDGKGVVRKLLFADIKSLDAGIFFDLKFKNVRVPSLMEFLDRYLNQLIINIEITNYATPFDDLAQEIASLIGQTRWNCNKILVSSFNPIALIQFWKSQPDISLGLLVGTNRFSKLLIYLVSLILPLYSVHPHYNLVTKEFVRQQHSKQIRVIPYTVNDSKLMRSLMDLGVDGFFTDDIPLAQTICSGYTDESFNR